jgi:uncharacterized membrane protein
MNKIKLLMISIIILSISTSIYAYPFMPEQMASHWNFKGEVDGYMPKFWNLFLVPMILPAMYLLFWLIPKIDPLKKNIKKFINYYESFILLMFSFLFYLQALVISWGFGLRFNMGLMMIPALSLVFYFIGIMLENAKMNWFIGIRTPWTMSSERVWDKTHKIGGKLFKASALISLTGLLIPDYAIYLVLIPVLISTIYLFIYSYFEFKKQR